MAPLAVVNPGIRAEERDTFFNHTPDYTMLTGKLHYVPSCNGWRLRYSSPDEADRYGGIVSLVGNGWVDTCMDGEMVSVEGTLPNPDTTEPEPLFCVCHLMVLKPAP